jgi:hypothetical protein
MQQDLLTFVPACVVACPLLLQLAGCCLRANCVDAQGSCTHNTGDWCDPSQCKEPDHGLRRTALTARMLWPLAAVASGVGRCRRYHLTP